VIEEPPVAPAVNARDTVVELVTVAVGVPGVLGTVVAVKAEDVVAAPVADTLVGVTVVV
jgi:hypothetical protein